MMRAAQKIDTAIRSLLYLLIFWIPYSPAVVETSVILAFLLWLVKRTILFLDVKKQNRILSFRDIVRAYQPVETPLNLAMGCFLSVCLLSVLNSDLALVALRGFFSKTLEWFVVYFLIVEVFKEKKHVFIFLSILLVTAVSTIFDSLWQFYISGKDIFFGREIAVTREGATAAFKHPNGLAGFLTVMVLFTLALVFAAPKKGQKLGALFIFSLALWTLAITYSRTAFLSTGLGILIFLGFFIFNKKVWAVRLSAVFFACVVFLILLSSLPWVKSARLSKSTLNEAAGWRLGIWQDSFKMIQEKPVLGFGLNTYMRVFKDYRQKQEGRYNYEPTYAHNGFIQMAAEVGLAGLAMFLWIWARLAVLLKDTFRASGERVFHLKMTALGLASGLLTFLLHSQFDNNLYSLQLSIYFWCIVGILVTILHLINQELLKNNRIT